MRLFFPVPSALLLLSLAACQTTGDHAVDVDAAVFRSDRGDDIQELWAVEAGTKRKLEPLLEGAASEFSPKFSPTKEWLAVEEVVDNDYTMTRLFHQEPSGGFRRIPEEEYVLEPYRNFLNGFHLQDAELTSRIVKVEKWARGGKDLVLSFEARTKEGKSFKSMHTVVLARHE